ncbi:MAG: bifunctional phosphoribosylaminoimidazolecarboxamide formyltransferase/IMP cyclohydrolase [candidate division Zixibacteria bacterium]|nr:bifunctional phosphoribosylaminoimidazolecarboxamide formyltransferase/IMP cyclohydrolase [candidate division Zixibacteria bacterium]
MTSAPIPSAGKDNQPASTTGLVRVRRAIISAYDKTGVVELAKTLRQYGVEIVSTGGTMAALQSAGIPVISVESLTGVGSMLGGRVKTLHPSLLGGVLGRPNLPSDRKELDQARIRPFELVIVNLYPFSKAANDPNASFDDAVELIDVGGPTMIRGAAKNHETVAVVCDPADYPALVAELNANDGATTLAARRRFAANAFTVTAAYDAKIASYLIASLATPESGQFPEILIKRFTRSGSLRYGENPHQQAAVYRAADDTGPSLANAPIDGGKELSYNNYGDLDAAWRMAADFTEPFAAVFKHANPCGAATGASITRAYELAYATDPLSAYGSIVALNRTVDRACADALNQTTFIECVIAPGYDTEALALMLAKKTRRYITASTMSLVPGRVRFREILGGLLVQDDDEREVSPADLTVVSNVAPTQEQIASLLFARKIVKHAKSNAIVLAQGTAAVGIGSGQTSRVDAVHSAVARAGDRAKGAVLASDAFFPMRDGPDAAAAAGVAAIIQPGGSKRDPEVIAACNEHGIAMVFSGVRNFRH